MEMLVKGGSMSRCRVEFQLPDAEPAVSDVHKYNARVTLQQIHLCFDKSTN